MKRTGSHLRARTMKLQMPGPEPQAELPAPPRAPMPAVPPTPPDITAAGRHATSQCQIVGRHMPHPRSAGLWQWLFGSVLMWCILATTVFTMSHVDFQTLIISTWYRSRASNRYRKSVKIEIFPGTKPEKNISFYEMSHRDVKNACGWVISRLWNVADKLGGNYTSNWWFE